MHADLTQELDIVQVEQPVRVVGDDGFAVGKIDETADLLLEAFHIVLDEFRRQHLAHLVLAARVADHARAAAQKDDGTVAGPLHMGHHHEGDEVTHMETVRGRVEADIERDLLFFEEFTHFFFMGQLFQVATFLERV